MRLFTVGKWQVMVWWHQHEWI